MRWTGVETPLELIFTPRNVAFYISFSPARSLRQKNSERRNKASPVCSVSFMMLLVHFTPCSHCRLYLPLSQMPPLYAALLNTFVTFCSCINPPAEVSGTALATAKSSSELMGLSQRRQAARSSQKPINMAGCKQKHLFIPEACIYKPSRG